MRGLLLPLLSAQMTASHQYGLGAQMLETAGYGRLARMMKGQSAERLRQAERLGERIAESGPVPIDPFRSGSDLREQFQQALQRETECVERVTVALTRCSGDPEWQDPEWRGLLGEFLEQHESFLDFLEAQLSQIKEVGYAEYRVEQLRM